MPIFRAQVVLPMFTNIPTDVVTNTLHFQNFVPTTLAAAAAQLTPLLEAFYSSVYQPQFLANYIAASGYTVRWYDLSQPTPRVPLIVPLVLTGVTRAAAQVPTETAMVISFQADREPGQPQARRRGRIYIGGLATTAVVSSSASQYPLLNGTFVAAARTASANLAAASEVQGIPWSVYSSTDGTAHTITNGWVDVSPDTQRRRGVETSIRNIWPA